MRASGSMKLEVGRDKSLGDSKKCDGKNIGIVYFIRIDYNWRIQLSLTK